MSDREFREILRTIGARSTIFAPLILRGRVVGVLRLSMAESGRKYAEEDIALAQDIARHVSLAIERAKLYRACADGDTRPRQHYWDRVA
jgi:GAF domain-containing protein